MRCPYRQIPGVYILPEFIDKEDTWQFREKFKEKKLNNFCSFCGSLNPDIFLDLIEKGGILVPTDKDYKAYIEYENSGSKFYFWHLSKDHINKYLELAERKKIKFDYPGFFYRKPYFLLLESVSPFSFGAVVTIEDKVEDGDRISIVKPIYNELIQRLRKDPNYIYSINHRIWEEIIAASYDKAGFDEIILTPGSGDLGRDVIAIKKGFGSIRFIEQVKAYNPAHLVTADEVRALIGVLNADHGATKAIFTTTSNFAPLIESDKFIKPYLPFRLELINKEKLVDRLLETEKILPK